MNINKLLTATASIITAGALIVGGTMAYFTSTDSNTGNTLGSGTLAIQLQDLMGEPLEGPLFNAINMMPGGPSVFSCATVANIGSLDANYTLKGIEASATSPSLSDVLWARSYKWVGGSAPEVCGVDENWELVVEKGLSTLPVSAVLNNEVKQGPLGTGQKEYYRWEYFLPGVLTLFDANAEPVIYEAPDQNAYQGAHTVLTFEAKGYQTNDPAYDAL